MEAAPAPGPGLCCKPGGRLDMSHGFVQHIRRNQIARDDYDKKVKQAAKEKARRRHTPAPTRPRKPDLQVYLPRRRGEAARPACLLQPARPSGPGPSAATHSPSLYGKKPLLVPRGSDHVAPARNLCFSRPPPRFSYSPRGTGRTHGPHLKIPIAVTGDTCSKKLFVGLPRHTVPLYLQCLAEGKPGPAISDQDTIVE
ncbi:UPF0561 protein C2orf68 homolog isoform X1 [Elephas maximus indicus]|uniref:UPF0561 protein C2orf68 homolog isoform X1 n=1 Tax=Elephas maximus indicus TaxID=99487 RepID=UPI0021163518|nr:UPF0561 protein C2orf68 homolog isoform X1 [Elephas maximus indicus]